MRIRIILVGKIREKYLREGVFEYMKRLKPYAQVELVELRDEPVPETFSEKQLALARETEAERILRTLRDNEYLVVLDIGGTQMSSEELSRWIQERALSGDSNLAFVIGSTTVGAKISARLPIHGSHDLTSSCRCSLRSCTGLRLRGAISPPIGIW